MNRSRSRVVNRLNQGKRPVILNADGSFGVLQSDWNGSPSFTNSSLTQPSSNSTNILGNVTSIIGSLTNGVSSVFNAIAWGKQAEVAQATAVQESRSRNNWALFAVGGVVVLVVLILLLRRK